ncbi:hypothetical protein CASFOL_012834 [Castilleja foliolosa]|uniref:Protein kinase domain-containing protein n=1 Tax=Castilleja foliolosa TaxID=1961234 RepID=A0ABD3DLR4_9LAMI
MGQSPCFGGVRATRQSNAAGNQAVAPSIPAGNQAAGPSNPAGSQAAGTSNPAGAVGNIPTAISLSTLKKATNDFTEQIGEGMSALVFKGKLDDGQLVAVKRMNPDCGREKSYSNEVGVLSRSDHPNIIKMIGCCAHNNTERIIVYEYMPNRTLHDLLHARGAPVLTWEKRMTIMAGIAEGLRYLHNNVRVLYGDLHPENVLLDAGYNPKLSDFGISVLLPADSQTTNDALCGAATLPYWPPEDVCPFSLKFDIYSFGVLLLKIITGTIKTKEGQLSYIDDSVMLPETFVQQADPKMKGDFPRGELVKAMTVATKCMNLCRDSRPDIGVVANAMKNLAGDQDAHWPKIFNTKGITRAHCWPELFNT